MQRVLWVILAAAVVLAVIVGLALDGRRDQQRECEELRERVEQFPQEADLWADDLERACAGD